jgi:hypothetical protein
MEARGAVSGSVVRQAKNRESSRLVEKYYISD